MQTALVDDELWELIQPPLPRRTRRYRHPGRRRLDDQCVLNGILFVLTTGIAWQRLPRELGFGSGMTCWRRLLITDANGVPLACLLTGANRHNVTQLLPLVEAIPPLRGKRGRPRRRPDTLLADRGYDSQPHRQTLRARGIKPLIAKRNTRHGSHLGSERWAVERTLSWLHQYRRLRIRYERRADIHEAFLSLACSLICLRQLSSSLC